MPDLLQIIEGIRQKKTQLQVGILCVLVAVSRYVFRSSYLYEWDSVQYALSIQKFDIMWHQPHPPGYIFYVVLIKLSHVLVGDPNLSMILVNILVSVVSLLIFYQFNELFFKSQRLALACSLMFAVNPIFWFCGSTSVIYVLEALISIVIGYTMLVALKSSSFKPLAIAIFFLGFLGGFRQTSTFLFIPLAIYVASRKIRSVNHAWKALLVFSVSIFLWWLPTIINTGGQKNYSLISEGLTAFGDQKMATFFGGYASYLLNNLANFAVWLLQGLTPVGVGIMLYAVFKYWKKYFVRKTIHNERGIFMILWTAPAAVLYLLYIEKAGYLLTIIPALLVFLTWSISRITTSGVDEIKPIRQANGMLFSMIVLMILWFVLPFTKQGIPQKLGVAAFIQQPPLSDYNWDVSARELRQKDFVLSQTQNILLEQGLREENTAIFYAGGYPTWRHLHYYLPGFSNYWLVDPTVSGIPQFHAEYYLARNFSVSSYSGLPFWVIGERPDEIDILLADEIDYLVWIADRDTTIYNQVQVNYPSIVTHTLSNGQEVLITRMQADPVDLGSFVLKH